MSIRVLINSMVLLLFVTFVFTVHAQQVILNTNGERVVIYPDGSWRYYEEGDSVLVKQQFKKEELYGEQDAEIGRTRNADNDPENIQATMRLALEFAELTQQHQHEANIALSKAMDAKFEIETQLAQARKNKNLIEPDKLGSLEDEYASKTELVRKAKKHLKKATSFATRAKKVVDAPARRRQKRLNKLMVAHDTYHMEPQSSPFWRTRSKIASGSLQKQNEPERKEPKAEDTAEKPNIITGGYERIKPYASYTRASAECRFDVQEISPGSEQKRIITDKNTLFTHTDEDLRPYFRQQELVTCKGQLIKLDDQIYLNLEFVIASSNARKNFGTLENGSLLRLGLIDQSEINLYNMRTDNGTIDPYSGHTRFIGQYLIDKQARKELERHELDKVRVVWSTGYEDYEIYHLDFMINQLNCLASAQQ